MSVQTLTDAELARLREAFEQVPYARLLGMEFVRADGTTTHSGGRVVKNVAGYDLGKLVTGSWGTLGLITAATFRLQPAPAARAWVNRAVETPLEVHDLVAAGDVGLGHDQVADAAVVDSEQAHADG